MKRFIFLVLQTLLLLVVYAVGSFVGPLHVQHVLSRTPTEIRIFVWDGVLLMLLVYALLLVLEALRKRLMQSSPWTTLALLLATGIGLALKLGFITHDIMR